MGQHSVTEHFLYMHMCRHIFFQVIAFGFSSIVPSVLILFVGFVGFDHGRHGRRKWVKPGFGHEKEGGNHMESTQDIRCNLFFLHFYEMLTEMLNAIRRS